MKRREFFRKMGLGAVGLAAAPVVGKALAKESPKLPALHGALPGLGSEISATNTLAVWDDYDLET